MTTRRVALAAGGTAGHVYPALAVAAELAQQLHPVEPLFIGTAAGFEARILPRHGYRLHTVSAAPLFGGGMLRKARTLPALCRGIAQARQLLTAHRAQMVLGFGGYVSAGAVLGGWSLGLRTALHEANVELGIANALLARVVDRVYLGFEVTSTAIAAGKRVVTGTPVRRDVASTLLARLPPDGARPFRILVTGGSQGSPFLNDNAVDLLQRLAAHGLRVEARHQAGDCDVETVRQRYARAQVAACVVAYIEDMADAYGWADFAITRSGAATIAELALCGLPALLVPLPAAARDHQTRNAMTLGNAGAGWWVSEKAWRADALAQRIAGLLRDPAAWQAAAQAAQRFATPDAARLLVADCVDLLA